MSNVENLDNTRRRGIYLLPNLLTTAALFSGYYAIVAAMQGKFEHAPIAIFAAMIFDGLDGRVARMTNTESAFGAQYDSMSDMLCFGVAPALVIYSWGLSSLGKIGWLAAFIYTAATALRLARFNLIGQNDKAHFIGLPSPIAAGVVAGMVWVATDFAIPGKRISEIMAFMTLAIALLQVSNIRYRSFKEIDLRENVPFMAVLLVVLLIALIAWDPPKILFCTFFIYTLSGPFMWVKEHYFDKRSVKSLYDSDDDNSHNAK